MNKRIVLLSSIAMLSLSYGQESMAMEGCCPCPAQSYPGMHPQAGQYPGGMQQPGSPPSMQPGWTGSWGPQGGMGGWQQPYSGGWAGGAPHPGSMGGYPYGGGSMVGMVYAQPQPDGSMNVPHHDWLMATCILSKEGYIQTPPQMNYQCQQMPLPQPAGKVVGTSPGKGKQKPAAAEPEETSEEEHEETAPPPKKKPGAVAGKEKTSATKPAQPAVVPTPAATAPKSRFARR